MVERVDVAIVGSGFGGAVMACRLAERGLSVVVLERGRRWTPDTFPRKFSDPWIFDPDEPARQNGWFDLRFMDDMVVAQGAGVGGGSLVYANVSVEAPEHIFQLGWPSQINAASLAPYYHEVGEMLDLQELPDNQRTPRFDLMEEAAQRSGDSGRFRKLPLAVRFDPDWHYGLDDRFSSARSKTAVNRFGREQGTCIHLGNCDVGCDVNARNTLDLNYLARAEDEGAKIWPLHLVDRIIPDGDGYRLEFRVIEVDNGTTRAGSLAARRVILSAGSLGSTELLLRARDQYRTLPGLSATLGKNWSSNGDFLTPAQYPDRKINPTTGPTITCAIDYLDGIVENQELFIEDGGFPDLLNNLLEAGKGAGPKQLPWKHRRLVSRARRFRKRQGSFEDLMPWFAQGVDAADGRLYLGRRWFAPWKRALKLDWDIQRSSAVIEAIIHTHRRLSRITGAGKVLVPPTWSLFRNLVTPHPLGGCNMGEDTNTGVVNHRGQVFGYDGLYVIDGAMIPEAIGRNPSRTIAALAERCAALFED